MRWHGFHIIARPVVRPLVRPVALLLALVASLTTAQGGDSPKPRHVRDLYYGEALFQFYRQDDFSALTHLLAAREAGRIRHHEAESELLLGGLYLSYGQHQRASDIFERLLTESTEPSVRDRAWFYLGKMRYQRALYAEALGSFAKVGGNLPRALAVELPMLVAQCHMARNDFAAAERALTDWDAPDTWLAYARYNLGVSLVRMNRIGEGAALLDRVGQMDAETAEDKNLRDKANLALGYAYLQINDAAQAKPVLQRVRLRSAFASKALLGVGWADAVVGDHRSALTPWLELTERDLMDSAVQESFLAVPYAMARLDASGSAVERYQQALGRFDTGMAQLDAAIGRARSGTLLPALLQEDDPELGRWYWRMQSLPANDDSRYLFHLMADHGFQEGFKNYRDLRALLGNLDQWRQSIETFDAMVQARMHAYGSELPAAQARLASIDMQALRARRDALAQRLADARKNTDAAVLAPAAQLDPWRRMQAIGAHPDLQLAENADLRARYRVLRGVLQWDLERQFKERAWHAGREINSLDAALVQAQARFDAASAAQVDEPARFAAFSQRIAALLPRIVAMQTSIDTTLEQQEQRLVALAVQELETQRERLASYRVQARFALATLYDRAAATQAASGGAAP